jgi:dihydrofolate reductase
MAHVVIDFTMSLDGFIAGPNVSVDAPMGEGGQRLHDWLFKSPPDDVDVEVSKKMFATTGAVILGRRTFDVGLEEWGDTPFPVPSFVVTHEARPDLVKKSGTFSFVTDGIGSAHRRAAAAAGRKNVRLMGADISQQFLKAALVDEISIQVAPVLLGEGVRLFDHIGADHIELERISAVESSRVTHLRFRVLK